MKNLKDKRKVRLHYSIHEIGGDFPKCDQLVLSNGGYFNTLLFGG